MATIKEIKAGVQVNIPYRMLSKGYLDAFINHSLNPEIGLDASALDNTRHEEFRYVKKQLARVGLTTTLHGPFIDMSPGSPDPQVWELTRRRFAQVIDVARIFVPKAVVFHAGYDHRRYGFVKEEWFEQSLRTWEWVNGVLNDEGISVSLENVFEEYPEYLLPLFEQLPGETVKFCFDTGHQAAFGLARLQDWLAVLGPYIGHLHLHDNNGKGDDHRALGSGSIDFHVLFDWLAEHFKVPPIITLEPHKEEDLLPSLNWLEARWPW